MKEGVDLSAYQHPNGAAIDYQAVKDSGRTFAIVKTSDGLDASPNPFASADLAGFHDAGMQTAAYHFFEPGVPGPDQAHTAMYSSRGQSIMLDAETGDPNMQVAELHAFIDTCHANGYLVLDYTNSSWYAATGPLGDATMMADPGVSQAPQGFDAWQYSWQGTVPGIQGYVDLDRWLDDSSYARFFGLTPTPTPEEESMQATFDADGNLHVLAADLKGHLLHFTRAASVPSGAPTNGWTVDDVTDEIANGNPGTQPFLVQP